MVNSGQTGTTTVTQVNRNIDSRVASAQLRSLKIEAMLVVRGGVEPPTFRFSG
jgi:hypothetical protein